VQIGVSKQGLLLSVKVDRKTEVERAGKGGNWEETTFQRKERKHEVQMPYELFCSYEKRNGDEYTKGGGKGGKEKT